MNRKTIFYVPLLTLWEKKSRSRCASRLMVWLVSLPVMLGLLAACTLPAWPGCAMQFQGTIRQGPSAGRRLEGNLTLRAEESGRLRGALVGADGTEMPVSGQVNRQAINLVFDLGENTLVFGMGTLQYRLRDCVGAAGGSLVGPRPGDSGDWQGQFPGEGGSSDDVLSPFAMLMGVILLAVIGYIGVVLYTRLVPLSYGKRAASPKGQPLPAVRSSGRAVQPEDWEDEGDLPMTQFMTTYRMGDDRYDMSFAINAPNGEFLGNCGVGIGEVFEPGPPKKVMALEIWLFDKNDIHTITKVLASQRCLTEPTLRSRLSGKDEMSLIAPDATLVLETRTLRLRVKVVKLDFEADAALSSSVISLARLKLGVWRKSARPGQT